MKAQGIVEGTIARFSQGIYTKFALMIFNVVVIYCDQLKLIESVFFLG